MMRVILVDDEQLARERMLDMLQRIDPSIEVVGEAANGREAVPLIYEKRPDLVFLDIQMPGLNGFDVIDLLASPRPHIVFVTAYDEYALRAFEVHALDYLMKPVSQDRLSNSLQRIATLIERNTPDEGVDRLAEAREKTPLRRLTLHLGRRIRVAEIEEVQYFEARDKLVFARLNDGKEYPVDFTLQALEKRLDQTLFVRTHRAYLVNIRTIDELISWFSGSYLMHLNDGTRLPVSRRRARLVKQALKG